MGLFSRRDRYSRVARTSSDVVASVRFSTTTFRAGYDPEGVDSFLARCVETLRWVEGTGPRPEDPVTVKAVGTERFSMTQFRSGYDQNEVDDLLDGVAATLHDAESAGPPSAPGADPASAS